MYEFFKGTLAHATPDHAVIDCAGVGYRVSIPVRLYGQLPPQGTAVTLWISHVVRDQSQALYGFMHRSERQLFEVLIGVSGVGPKMALALLGHLDIDQFTSAVSANDVRTVTRVPGIGKKTAERLILEIRDKLPALFARDDNMIQPAQKDWIQASLSNDAIGALVNLGYTQTVAHKAVSQSLEQLGEDADLGEVVTQALREVAGSGTR